jgi:hypothetical protein
MRANMTPHYAAQVYEVEMESNAMTVYAPAGKLQERGHTVNQPLLTIRFPLRRTMSFVFSSFITKAKFRASRYLSFTRNQIHRLPSREMNNLPHWPAEI